MYDQCVNDGQQWICMHVVYGFRKDDRHVERTLI